MWKAIEIFICSIAKNIHISARRIFPSLILLYLCSSNTSHAGECLTTDKELYENVIEFSKAAKKGEAGIGEYLWGIHCWRGDKRYENKLKELLRNMMFDSRLHPAYIASAARDYAMVFGDSPLFIDEMKKKQGDYRYTLIKGSMNEHNTEGMTALIGKAATTFSDYVDYIDGPANIRNAPKGAITATLPDNTKIRVIQQKDEWLEIEADNMRGWTFQGNLMGKNLNLIDSDGFTPLSRSAFMGYLETVLFLQHKGADINLVDTFGRNALHWAVRGGFADMGGIEIEILKKIVSTKGIEVNRIDNEGLTPLMLAIQNGRYDMIQILMEKEGIDVNLADKEGATPLIMAVKYDNAEIIRALLNKRTIRMDDADVQGRTALYHAIVSRNQAVIKLLLERRARTDVVTTNGKTLLHALFQPLPYRLTPDPPNIEIVKMLLACKDIDINKKDNSGNTALSLAIGNDMVQVVKQLLTLKKLDVNKKMPSGDSPLNMVIGLSDLSYSHEMSMLLLDREDIDVNVPDHMGQTAVHMGWYNIGMGSSGIEKARKILARNPKLEVEDNYGETPLIYNIKQNHPEMVRLLVAVKGINLYHTDRQTGKTPLGLAKDLKLTEIVNILIKAGAR